MTSTHLTFCGVTQSHDKEFLFTLVVLSGIYYQTHDTRLMPGARKFIMPNVYFEILHLRPSFETLHLTPSFDVMYFLFKHQTLISVTMI